MTLPIISIAAGAFTILGGAVWAIAARARRTQKTRSVALLQKKILTRCPPNPELLTFLGSDTGQRFMDVVASLQTDPANSILAASAAGTVFSFCGVAFFILLNLLQLNAGGREAFMTLGVVYAVLGTAFIVSSIVSYLLCKSWRLLPPTEEQAS